MEKLIQDLDDKINKFNENIEIVKKEILKLKTANAQREIINEPKPTNFYLDYGDDSLKLPSPPLNTIIDERINDNEEKNKYIIDRFVKDIRDEIEYKERKKRKFDDFNRGEKKYRTVKKPRLDKYYSPSNYPMFINRTSRYFNPIDDGFHYIRCKFCEKRKCNKSIGYERRESGLIIKHFD